MLGLSEFICEAVNVQGKIKATGDSTSFGSYLSQIKFEMKYHKEIKMPFYKIDNPTDKEFIDAFSKYWSPTNGGNDNDGYAARCVAHYLLKNMNLKCVSARIAGEGTNKKFKIYYMPLDSKARYCSDYVESDENTAYSTIDGFHVNEDEIHWYNKDIKNRTDLAKIVLKTIKKIKSNN